MTIYSKHLTDSEVKNKHIELPKGKEKIFPKKGDFNVVFSNQKYMAFILPHESKALGPKKKIFEYRLIFREPLPNVFLFDKLLTFTSEDGLSWELKLS